MKKTIKATLTLCLVLFGFMEAIAHQSAASPCIGVATETADTTAGEWLRIGDEKYDQKDYAGAAACYGKGAEQGLAEAQFKYGYALYFGEGIGVDYTTASMWFKRAALQGHGKAMNNLAFCYMYGKGVPTDYDKALQYLKDAANTGFKEAQITLAECYEKGVLVEKDEQEARRWSQIASAPPTPPANDTHPEPDTSTNDSSGNIHIEEVSPDTPVMQAQNEQPDGTIPHNPSQAGKPTILSKEDILNKGNEPKTAPTAPATEEQTSPTADASATEEQASPMIAVSTIAAKAPVVNILFPVDNAPFHTNSIKIKYQLIAKGLEDKTRITVMVDGVKQPTDRTVRAASTIDVDLPDHDCTVILYAQNEYGNSEPASIRLKREKRQEEKPRLLAVAIGIGQYNDPQLPSLKFTCKDARDFCSAITKKKKFPYSEVQVKLLCDSMATRGEIFEAMEWLKQEATPNDVCMFYYAGHGYRDEKDRFYFMSYGGTTNRLYDCFSSADFRRVVEDVNSKLVVFVDACFSGALMEGNRSASTNFIDQLRRTKNGMVLYASSSSDTKSKEDSSWGNGAFTKALVEALNGAARGDDNEGLSTQVLEQYLYKEVKRLTDAKQIPVFMNPNGIEHFYLFTYEEDQP